MFIGSCSGHFYALDCHDGRPLWSHDATLDGGPQNFHGNVVLVDDFVVVGTDAMDEGFLVAFDRATGEVRWRHAAPGGFPSDPAVRGTTGFVVAMDGTVRCFDLRDGTTRWSVELDADERMLRSAVLVVEDRVVVSLPSGSVVALEADTGEPVWTTSLPGRANTSLVRIGDDVFVGDLDGRIHRIAIADGRIVAAVEGESPAYGALLSAGDCLLALWAETTFACIDPEQGDLRWSRTAPTTWSSFQPLVLDGHVLVGDASGEIHAIRLSDGATAWTLQLTGEIKGLGAHDGMLYVGTVQGRVSAVPLPALGRPAR